MNENKLQDTEFDTELFAQNIVSILWDSKIKNAIAIDLRGRVSYTDFVVIGTGTSPLHVQSAANNLMIRVKNENGIIPLGNEGLAVGDWGLIDLGDVIVHLFNGTVRDEYDFETMWIDAPRLELEDQPQDLYGTFELDYFPEE